LAALPRLDAQMAARVAAARKKGNVLRYLARVDRRVVRVGLESVPEASPSGRLQGLDNQVVLFTDRYKANPLVVTGPGAGAEVTAAGVLNDILAIATRAQGR
ncbi:MAG: homoserine dehydrogenase, partial [Deltaproteobacteria bacterium]|nr:homoserine dehydrogenase [Deltaproteobacteria bacterium]